MKNVGIGVDIGGSHIVSCAVDMASGKPIEGTLCEGKVNNKGTKQEVFETWARVINTTMGAAGSNLVDGIGFAMPGAFNYKTGVAYYEGNDKYEQLYGVNVKEEFPEYLDKEGVNLRFINDATAFAVGEAWFGLAKGSQRSVSITLGTGFGSALIEEGVPVVKREDVPEEGCFWHLPFRDGMADDYFSTRWFVNSFESLTGEKVPGVKEVAGLASEREDVNRLFVEFGENMADFLMPWFEKFEPQILVVGGNVSRAFGLIQPAFERVIGEKGIDLKIAISSMMEESALVGSARLLDDGFWDRVKDNLPEK